MADFDQYGWPNDDWDRDDAPTEKAKPMSEPVSKQQAMEAYKVASAAAGGPNCNVCLTALSAIYDFIEQSPDVGAEDAAFEHIARDVAEALENGDGFWQSCSGCYETNEGYDTGPKNPVFKCVLGNGCSECGGIGAIWDTTDYAAMGAALAADMNTPAPSTVSVGREDLREVLAAPYPKTTYRAGDGARTYDTYCAAVFRLQSALGDA